MILFFRTIAIIILFSTFLTSYAYGQSISPYWTDAESNVRDTIGLGAVKVKKYRIVKLDMSLLNSLLTETRTPKIISLPMPNGDNQLFSIKESSVMSPELKVKYPNLLSFQGNEILRKDIQVTITISDNILRAQIRSEAFNYLISPVPSSSHYYIVYDVREASEDKSSRKY